MSLYEETSGTSAEDLYEANSFRPSAWGRSWGMAWAFAWGFVLDTPFLDSSGTQPDDVYSSVSDEGGTLYNSSSGTSHETIYEEN